MLAREVPGARCAVPRRRLPHHRTRFGGEALHLLDPEGGAAQGVGHRGQDIVDRDPAQTGCIAERAVPAAAETR